MGQSTDALIAYGIDFGEDLPKFIGEYESFEEWLQTESGLPKYGEPGHSFEAFWDFEKKYPVEMIIHCSYDCPMYILAVNGTKLRAARGYVEEVKMNITEEQKQVFIEFCEKYGIENPEPKWLLFSMWG